MTTVKTLVAAALLSAFAISSFAQASTEPLAPVGALATRHAVERHHHKHHRAHHVVRR